MSDLAWAALTIIAVLIIITVTIMALVHSEREIARICIEQGGEWIDNNCESN